MYSSSNKNSDFGLKLACLAPSSKSSPSKEDNLKSQPGSQSQGDNNIGSNDISTSIEVLPTNNDLAAILGMVNIATSDEGAISKPSGDTGMMAIPSMINNLNTNDWQPPPGDLPPTNTNWKPPPVLPPTIDRQDTRFSCPPPSKNNDIMRTKDTAKSPIRSGLYGNLAPKKMHHTFAYANQASSVQATLTMQSDTAISMKPPEPAATNNFAWNKNDRVEAGTKVRFPNASSDQKQDVAVPASESKPPAIPENFFQQKLQFPVASNERNVVADSKPPAIPATAKQPTQNEGDSDDSSLFSSSDDEDIVEGEKSSELDRPGQGLLQTNNIVDQKKEDSDDESLFSDSDDEGEGEEQPAASLSHQSRAQLHPAPTQDSLPQADTVYQTNKDSDDESLFGDSDDEEEAEAPTTQQPLVEPQPAPTVTTQQSQPPIQTDLPSTLGDSAVGGNTETQNNPSSSSQHQYVVFEPPSVNHTEEESESEGSTDEGSVFSLNEDDGDNFDEENEGGATSKGKGLLGGLLKKISMDKKKKKKKNRDENSFGKAGYTIKKKKSKDQAGSSSSNKNPPMKLIQKMISPPLPSTQQKKPSSSQAEILARLRCQKELELSHGELEGMKEVAFQSREKERERQYQQSQATAAAKNLESLAVLAAVGQETVEKKTVSFTPLVVSKKSLGKSARALDTTPAAVSKASLWKAKMKSKKQQRRREQDGPPIASASLEPAAASASISGTKKNITKPALKGADAKKEEGWNKLLAHMKKYIIAHGNCAVPFGHSLQDWIHCQRNICKRWLKKGHDPHKEEISKQELFLHIHICKLERIGFDWGMGVSRARVREALAAENMMLSPAQRELLLELLLDVGVSDDNKDGAFKKKKNGKREDDSVNGDQKESVFDSTASKKRQRSSSHDNDDSDKEEFEFSDANAVGRTGSANGHAARAVALAPSDPTTAVSNSSNDEENIPLAKLRKKRPRSAMSKEAMAMALISNLAGDSADHCKNLENEDDYADEQPNFISWNKPPRKRGKIQRKNHQHALGSMPAELWVELIEKFNKSLAQGVLIISNASEGCDKKCWFELELAGKREGSVHDIHAPAPKTGLNAHQASTLSKNGNVAKRKNIKQTSATSESFLTRKNIKQTSAANNKSSLPMKMLARTPLKIPATTTKSGLLDGLTALPAGTRVYAAWWKSKNKRSTPPYYYPGVVIKSYKIVDDNGKNKSTTSSLLFYDINYDDGDCLCQINSSLVIPRKKYLKHNLKPLLKVGEKVYAAWWEDGQIDVSTAKEWYSGVIKARIEGEYGGPYGPIRSYDVTFDDGDELDGIPDSFVMNKNDYLLSVRKDVADDYDFDDDASVNGGDGQREKWMGVKNKLDKSCIAEDEWARDVGWYVATINGTEQPFPQLSAAIRAYDAHTARSLRASTQKSHLNLPEEWAFPSPLGICPPVHIGGNGAVRDTDRVEKKSQQVYTGVDVNDCNNANLNHATSNNHNKEKVDNSMSLSKEEVAPSITADSKNQSPNRDASPDNHGKCEGASSDTPKLVDSTDKNSKTHAPNFNVKAYVQTKGKAVLKAEDKVIQTVSKKNHGGPDNTASTGTALPSLTEDGRAPATTNDVTSSTMSDLKDRSADLGNFAGKSTVTISNELAKNGALSISLGSPMLDTTKKSPSLQKVPAKSDHTDYPPDLGDFASRNVPKGSGSTKMSSSNGTPCDAPTKAKEPATCTSKDEITSPFVQPQELPSNHSHSPSLKINPEASQALEQISTADQFESSDRVDNDETKSNDKEYKQPALLELTPTKSSSNHSALSEKESNYLAVPAVGFPDGWMVRKIPRPSRRGVKAAVDYYYYSPIKSFKFRSKSALKRFLECVKRVNGDEVLAMEEFTEKAMSYSSGKINNAKCNESNYKLTTETMLGHTRSTTKAILNIIDLTDPETDSTPLKSVDGSAQAPAIGTLTKTQTESCPVMPWKGFPNWTVRHIPRIKSSGTYTHYYSPSRGYTFRSKVDVIRFLGCLKRMNGNEALAMKEFRLEFRNGAKKIKCSPSDAMTVSVEKELGTGPAPLGASQGVVHYNVKHGIANDSKKTTEMTGHKRSSTKAIVELIGVTGPVNNSERPNNDPISDTGDANETSAARSISVKSKKISPNWCIRHPSVSEKESAYPAMPAKDFPSDWTIRQIPRSSTASRPADTLYYSPRGYKFRSKPEVQRFLECMKQKNGDEASAIEQYHRSLTKRPKKRLSDAATEQARKSQKLLPRYKVLEYVEPSKSVLKRNGVREDDEKKAKEEEAISNPTSTSNGHAKPLIKKGDKVYACWSGPAGLGQDWFPGRVWDVRVHPATGEYGSIKSYDVVFDDGDTETGMKEIWVSKEAEYEVCIRKPNENEWIGVTNVCYPESKDEYARMIGWYQTHFGDGMLQLYPSLGEALRAYDKHIVEIRGKNRVCAEDLNFPEEHDLSL